MQMFTSKDKKWCFSIKRILYLNIKLCRQAEVLLTARETEFIFFYTQWAIPEFFAHYIHIDVFKWEYPFNFVVWVGKTSTVAGKTPNSPESSYQQANRT